MSSRCANFFPAPALHHIRVERRSRIPERVSKRILLKNADRRRRSQTLTILLVALRACLSRQTAPLRFERRLPGPEPGVLPVTPQGKTFLHKQKPRSLRRASGSLNPISRPPHPARTLHCWPCCNCDAERMSDFIELFYAPTISASRRRRNSALKRSSAS